MIVAGGTGERMKSRIPKQFVEIAGLPVLMHTLNAFLKAVPDIHLVIVLPAGQVDTWNVLLEKHSFRVPHRVTEGGQKRFYSVRNGLEHIPDDSVVAIHDGVRPVITSRLIRTCFQDAVQYGSAIPCLVPSESVRTRKGKNYSPMDHNDIRIIQTPQAFQAALIKKAYQQPFRDSFTDDATVLERSGMPVHLVQGDPFNIKITYPEDLIVAEAILKMADSCQSSLGNLQFDNLAI